jgi:uncharacterized integral membrane protein
MAESIVNQAWERIRQLKPRTIVIIVIAVLALVLVLQNTQDTQFHFFFWDLDRPLWLWLLLLFAAGFVVGSFAPWLTRFRKRTPEPGEATES